MHKSLAVSEILAMVLDAVEQDTTAASKSLLCLALVNKSFHDEAMKRLWRNGELSHLLTTLPRHLWTITRANEQYFLSFTKPLLDVDWARFNLYAALVETLSISEGKAAGFASERTPAIDRKTLEAVVALNWKPSFTHTTKLEISAMTTAYITGVLDLVGDLKIRTIWMRITESMTENEMKGMLEACVGGERAHSLRRLEFHHVYSGKNGSRTLIPSTGLSGLFQAKNLTELELTFNDIKLFDGVDDPALFMLARGLPSLQKLHIFGSEWRGHLALTELVKFAQNHFRFRELGMMVKTKAIDYEDVTVPVAWERCYSGYSQLKKLHVSCSKVKNAKQVARFLYDCLPNLERIVGRDIWGEEDEPSAWDEVNEELLRLKASS